MGRGEDPTTYEFSLREMASIEELLIAMLSYEPSAYYHDGAHWNSIDGKLGFELRDAVCSEYVSICCSPAAPERFLVDSARNLPGTAHNCKFNCGSHANFKEDRHIIEHVCIV